MAWEKSGAIVIVRISFPGDLSLWAWRLLRVWIIKALGLEGDSIEFCFKNYNLQIGNRNHIHLASFIKCLAITSNKRVLKNVPHNNENVTKCLSFWLWNYLVHYHQTSLAKWHTLFWPPRTLLSYFWHCLRNYVTKKISHYSFFWLCCIACRILISLLGIILMPFAVEAWNLTHRTIREVPHFPLNYPMWNHLPQIGTWTHVLGLEPGQNPVQDSNLCDQDLNPAKSHGTWFQDMMKFRFLISARRKNSVRDKVIGKKWVCSDSERNTLHRQNVGHRRGRVWGPWNVVWLAFMGWVIS